MRGTVEDSFVTAVRRLVREVMPIVLKAVAAESRAAIRKDDGTFVTETDIAVERLLCGELHRLFPSIPILGEEGVTVPDGGRGVDPRAFYTTFLGAPSHIILDPIDGTKNFIDGGKPFCVAVALTRAVGDGVWPIAGVVALPLSDSMVWTDGGGVRCEELSSGAVREVQRRTGLERRISVNSSDREWLSTNGFEMRMPWVSSGSSVNDFIGTATGDLCGSMVGKQRLWDLMAPLAIAERLGCVLRDLRTGEILSQVGASDLSPDLANRPWGIERKMVIAPRGRSVTDLIAPSKR
jgi:fructose-1,6-bisphosphatase/inositol monophosphatase family enzyme